MKSRRFTRRTFLMGAAMAAAGCATGSRIAKAAPSPNEKLNIAGIGVGGKGTSDIWPCRGHNVVALCDVDDVRAAESIRNFPNATYYKDFRVMLEKENIDAVTISTPDHTHAVAAMAAMQLGIHVYVQKPLTHTVAEARMLTEAARRYGVATQMGNQGHADEGVRQLCEVIWSGALGDITEVHCWTDRPIWPQGLVDPLAAEEVPAHMDWDLWLGPAPYRDYNAGYAPFAWRGWWDFGCGALGDMACHIMDPAYWALHLGAPTSVECVRQEGNTAQSAPTKSVIRYDFPEREADGRTWPAVTFYWYDGGELPERPEGIPAEEKLGDGDNGTLFIGSKGFMSCGTYGGNPRLHPEAENAAVVIPEPYIERVPDNSPYEDWFRACMGGPAACSNFDYSGPFSEIVLLGNIALRTGQRIEWDAANMQVTNLPEANALLTRDNREGWKI